jgi:hypothetical protein
MNRKFLVISAILPMLVGSIYGSLVAWNSLATLGQSADLIVVAAASDGRIVGTALNFTLGVSRVLKGDGGLAGASVSVSWPRPPSAQGGFPAPDSNAAGNGLWFLKNSPDGWQLLPVMQGGVSFSHAFIASAPGPIPPAYAYSETSAINDKIASEVSASVEGGIGDGARLASLASGLLDQLKSPVVQQLYQRMAASGSPNQRLLGLSGLIRAGSTEALGEAAQNAASLLTAYPIEGGALVQSVRDQFRPSDSSSVTALGQMATDSANVTGPFRIAAAHALASVHTKDALPYLAALLDDPDTSFRIEGIGGLGAFANGLSPQSSTGVPGLAGLQMPANAPYRTPDTIANFAMGQKAISQNENRYLSFWRAWWLQNRTALGY